MIHFNPFRAFSRWRHDRAIQAAFDLELGKLLAYRSGQWGADIAGHERRLTDAEETARQRFIGGLRMIHGYLETQTDLARRCDAGQEFETARTELMRLAARAARTPLAWEAGHRDPHSVNYARAEYPMWLS